MAAEKKREGGRQLQYGGTVFWGCWPPPDPSASNQDKGSSAGTLVETVKPNRVGNRIACWLLAFVGLRAKTLQSVVRYHLLAQMYGPVRKNRPPYLQASRVTYLKYR